MSHRCTRTFVPAWAAVPAIAILVLAGCGTPAQPVQPAAGPQAAATVVQAAPVLPTSTPALEETAAPAQAGDRLYVRDGYAGGRERIVVVHTASGTRERELPPGMPAPDWSVLYTVEHADGRTIVRTIEMATGHPARETVLDGNYILPAIGLDGLAGGLSANGAWLALMALPSPADLQAYKRDRNWQSRFAVLDTAFATPPRHVELKGNFWFDALSDNGAALYLIENLPPEEPEQYQVRRYDLAAGALNPNIVADKTTGVRVMQGVRQTAVPAPNGQWLYSLYLNHHHGPFIHALNLDGFAVCIDLPKTGKEEWEKQLFWSLVRTRDGSKVYAANGALGLVAELDTAQLKVRRTAALPLPAASANPLTTLARRLVPAAEAKRIPIGGMALSPDEQTLYTLGEKGLLAINTSDFSLRGRYLDDWTIDSVALSPDGARLYAVSAERGTIVRLDAATGTRQTIVTGVDRPWGVLRVETIGF